MVYRVGLIVPSSNTTMETELPQILRSTGEIMTFHSSRVRMKTVSPEGLAAMTGETARASQELGDARCDVVAYACLVAVMAQGPGAHTAAEGTIAEGLAASGSRTPVVSSAGALIDGIHALGAKRVAIVTPYVKSLTDCVIDSLGDSEIEVVDSVSLEVSDNIAVGRISTQELRSAFQRLNLSGAEALVISACVQMPSLPLIEAVQATAKLPVLSAASATARSILLALGLSTSVPMAGGGALLA